MSRSNDAGHYFQTTESIATSDRKAAKAKNEHGSPVRLPSKLLSIHAGETSDAVFVAESAGPIKRVNLQTGGTTRISGSTTVPSTSIAISASTKELFFGSWDKDIHVVSLSNLTITSERFSGHVDNVTCLLVTSLRGKPILVSGGTDSTIIVWDVTSRSALHKLKGHTRGLQDLAIDPMSLPEDSMEPTDSFCLFSASSDREIRRWHISTQSSYELPDPILAHETSVYKIAFDSEGDLWTASADNTAKHLVRSRHWEADTVLQHTDFVRDVVVAEQHGVVVTACRDEEIRVWDIASGDLLCTYSGHFEEVMRLVLTGPLTVVSVSIDGTVRKWSLDRNEMAKYVEDLQQESEGQPATDGTSKGLLTAEEEAELAELMDDSN